MKRTSLFAWLLVLPSLSHAQFFDEREAVERASRQIAPGAPELSFVHTGTFAGAIDPTLEEIYAVKLARALNKQIDRQFRQVFRDALDQWEGDFQKWLKGYIAGLAVRGLDTFEYGSKGYAVICGETGVHCYNRGAKHPEKTVRLTKSHVERMIEHVIATLLDSGEWGSGWKGNKTKHVTEVLEMHLYPPDENRNVPAPESQPDKQ